jgi:hypothetical protein
MFLEIFTYWQVIVICLLFMIILPLIFYFASFDKRKLRLPPELKKPLNVGEESNRNTENNAAASKSKSGKKKKESEVKKNLSGNKKMA